MQTIVQNVQVSKDRCLLIYRKLGIHGRLHVCTVSGCLSLIRRGSVRLLWFHFTFFMINLGKNEMDLLIKKIKKIFF